MWFWLACPSVGTCSMQRAVTRFRTSAFFPSPLFRSLRPFLVPRLGSTLPSGNGLSIRLYFSTSQRQFGTFRSVETVCSTECYQSKSRAEDDVRHIEGPRWLPIISDTQTAGLISPNRARTTALPRRGWIRCRTERVPINTRSHQVLPPTPSRSACTPAAILCSTCRSAATAIMGMRIGAILGTAGTVRGSSEAVFAFDDDHDFHHGFRDQFHDGFHGSSHGGGGGYH